MGTDLERTIEDLKWQVDYYIECCNVANGKEEILSKLSELVETIKSFKEDN